MPKVPDASSVTRLRSLQSSVVADPVKRSASYVPNQPALLYSLRASDVGKGVFPGRSVLSTPIARRYVNPRHQGYVTGPTPRVTIPISGTDFDALDKFSSVFEAPVFPPGPNFDVVFVVGAEQPTNVEDLTIVRIFNTDTPASPVFGSTIISTTPAWPGATFTSSTTAPSLSAAAGTFPGMSTVIQFRNVPVITNVTIEFGGGSYTP